MRLNNNAIVIRNQTIAVRYSASSSSRLLSSVNMIFTVNRKIRPKSKVLTAMLGQPARLDLQTSQSRTVLRPFHGHIADVARLGANGGFARSRLVIADHAPQEVPLGGSLDRWHGLRQIDTGKINRSSWTGAAGHKAPAAPL